jgi:hypothetical protein
MSLLGGLLGGGQQPASGADPVGAIVLDVVNELKTAVVRRKKSPHLSSGRFRPQSLACLCFVFALLH